MASFRDHLAAHRGFEKSGVRFTDLKKSAWRRFEGDDISRD
jgi:hypothetical protein